jgi:hypothetical protein
MLRELGGVDMDLMGRSETHIINRGQQYGFQGQHADHVDAQTMTRTIHGSPYRAAAG